MPHSYRQTLRRVLSGLLVLAILAMSVVRANAMLSPDRVSVATAVIAAHTETHHESRASTRDVHATLPCPGHIQANGLIHADGLSCCLGCECSFLSGNLPCAPVISRPAAAAALTFATPSAAAPHGFSSAPTLPPPRSV